MLMVRTRFYLNRDPAQVKAYRHSLNSLRGQEARSAAGNWNPFLVLFTLPARSFYYLRQLVGLQKRPPAQLVPLSDRQIRPIAGTHLFARNIQLRADRMAV